MRSVEGNATVFAALGDRTRLAILIKLGERTLLSIAQLTAGSTMTRQAIAKHLRVLESAGLVRSTRRGRESLYELRPAPLADARRALEAISQQWDDALARLKAYVER
jgi:DNA-binding transcriptional ArsR family regulator